MLISQGKSTLHVINGLECRLINDIFVVSISYRRLVGLFHYFVLFKCNYMYV